MSDDKPRQLPTRLAPAALGLPEAPTGDLERIRNSLVNLGSRANLIGAPMTSIQSIPADHVVALRVVVFPTSGIGEIVERGAPPARSNGVWYQCDGGKLALHRSALDALASAAGLTDVAEACKVEKLGRYHWQATHTVQMLTLEGAVRKIRRDVELDLEDGSPEAAAYKAPSMLANARKFGSRVAQTKAANRAIRAALGIQSGYDRAAAERNFVLPVLIYQPPMADPVVRRLVAAQRLGLTAQLYGPDTSRQLERDDEPADFAPEEGYDAEYFEAAGGAE